MKIDVLPRRVFEKAQESDAETELLTNYRIISINSRDESPPFSDESLSHPNLLCLVFDDICNEPSPGEDISPARMFSSRDAQRILEFVKDDSMPLLIHCTAGISRSGAVGECLDLYFNRWRCNNRRAHLYFLDNNPQIMPNPIVRRIFLEEILKELAK